MVLSCGLCPAKVSGVCSASELRKTVATRAEELKRQAFDETHVALERLGEKREFKIPARPGTRGSLGLDRDVIPEARIGWQVLFFWKKTQVATGIVRQFVARPTKMSDLVIVRLNHDLNVKKLIEESNSKNEDTDTIILEVNLRPLPCMLRRNRRVFWTSWALDKQRFSQVARELIFPQQETDSSDFLDETRSHAKLAVIHWNIPELNISKSFERTDRYNYSLSKEQRECLFQAITRRATLIDGCPGSGKTRLAACIAHCLFEERDQKVLVCAPYDSSVDLIVKLSNSDDLFNDQNSLMVTRVTDANKFPNRGLTRHADWAAKQSWHNSSLIEMIEVFVCDRYKRKLNKTLAQDDCLDVMLSAGFCLDSEWISEEKRTEQIERILEKAMRKGCCKKTMTKVGNQVLHSTDIVCCTLKQTHRSLINLHLDYDVLIIDDAHLAEDVDLIMALLKPGLKQVIMLGDSGHNPRSQGLFQKIRKDQDIHMTLSNQFRSHDKLMNHCNELLFDGRLKSPEEWSERNEISQEYLHWMRTLEVDCLTCVFATSSGQQIKTTTEVLIDKLTELGFKTSVITTDKRYIREEKINGVKVCAVHDMIGCESDCVILSCDQWSHRSQRYSYEMDPNFMFNEQALQIAMTRAKVGIFIVAEQSLLDSVQSKASSLSGDGPIKDIDQETNGSTAGNYCEQWRKVIKYHSDRNSIKPWHILNYEKSDL